MKRNSFTILELLVVISIVAILLGLLLAAVQKARVSALAVASKNQVKQIVLATHAFSEVYEGKLPAGGPMWNNVPRPPAYSPQIMKALLPYIDQMPLSNYYRNGSSSGIIPNQRVALYVNPLDPSNEEGLGLDSSSRVFTSYAYNFQVFGLIFPTISRVLDGASNTIYFAEHYRYCGNTIFAYVHSYPGTLEIYSSPTDFSLMRHASFADGADPNNDNFIATNHDVYPIQMPNQNTVSSMPGKTFQHRPRTSQCDPRLAQSTSTGGITVGMGDGSVRIISPQVSERVFWGAVTPAGGEVVNLD
jgi:type II secretory pathway pseudopilin PulG